MIPSQDELNGDAAESRQAVSAAIPISYTTFPKESFTSVKVLKFKFRVTDKDLVAMKTLALAMGKRSVSDYIAHCIHMYTTFAAKELEAEKQRQAIETTKALQKETNDTTTILT